MDAGELAVVVVPALVGSSALGALVAEALHRTRPGRHLDAARALKDQADILRELEAEDRSGGLDLGAARAIRASLRRQVLGDLVPPFGSGHLLAGILVAISLVTLGIGLLGLNLAVGISMIVAGVVSLALFVFAAIGTARVEAIALSAMGAPRRGSAVGGGEPHEMKLPRTYERWYKRWKSDSKTAGGEMFGPIEEFAVDPSVRSVVRGLVLSTLRDSEPASVR